MSHFLSCRCEFSFSFLSAWFSYLSHTILILYLLSGLFWILIQFPWLCSPFLPDVTWQFKTPTISVSSPTSAFVFHSTVPNRKHRRDCFIKNRNRTLPPKCKINWKKPQNTCCFHSSYSFSLLWYFWSIPLVFPIAAPVPNENRTLTALGMTLTWGGR